MQSNKYDVDQEHMYFITEKLNQVLLPATFLYATNGQGGDFQNLRIAGISALAIGSVNYLSMLYWDNKNLTSEQSALNKEFVRYVDWLITTPTNVFVVWYYAAVELPKQGLPNNIINELPLWYILTPIILSNFCSLMTYWAKRSNSSHIVRMTWQILSYVFLAISIMQVIKLASLIDLKLIPFFLIGTWIAYNIGATLSNPVDRAIVFNITDLFAKIIFVYYFSFNFVDI